MCRCAFVIGVHLGQHERVFSNHYAVDRSNWEIIKTISLEVGSRKYSKIWPLFLIDISEFTLADNEILVFDRAK